MLRLPRHLKKYLKKQYGSSFSIVKRFFILNYFGRNYQTKLLKYYGF